MASSADKPPKEPVTCRQMVAIIGAFIIIFPTGFTKVWGNISTYIVSYLYYEYKVMVSSQIAWALSAFIIGNNTGYLISGRLRFFKAKTIILTAITIFNTGFFCLYLAVRYNVVPLLFVVLAILGLNSGVICCTIFKCAETWSTTRKGLFLSTAASAVNFGPFFSNLLMTFDVNPDNLDPDRIVGKVKVFSEESVDTKVPMVFIIMAVLFLVCQAVGFIMIFYGGPKSADKTKSEENIVENGHNHYGSTSTENTENGGEIQENGGGGGDNKTGENDHAGFTTARQNTESSENNGSLIENGTGASVIMEVNGGRTDNTVLLDRENESDKDRQNKTNEEENGGEVAAAAASAPTSTSMTPGEALRSSTFYVLLMGSAFSTPLNLLLSNYYKTFGQTWISDDHLFGVMGSILGLVGGATSFGWGFILDKFHIKTCLIFLHSILANILLFMYFTPSLNKWLYAVITLTLGGLFACINPSYIVSSMRYFGPDHFDVILGMILTGKILMNFIVPPTFTYLLHHCGWFSLFAMSTAFMVFPLIFFLVLLPLKVKTK